MKRRHSLKDNDTISIRKENLLFSGEVLMLWKLVGIWFDDCDYPVVTVHWTYHVIKIFPRSIRFFSMKYLYIPVHIEGCSPCCFISKTFVLKLN